MHQYHKHHKFHESYVVCIVLTACCSMHNGSPLSRSCRQAYPHRQTEYAGVYRL
ncbi:hypothetical protein BDW62DRAFT_190510 [Aspergillus aurantiobrunneus]